MKVAIVLANGFEELEAISIIDILRRADIDALAVGLEKKCVRGTHDIELVRMKFWMILRRLNFL